MRREGRAVVIVLGVVAVLAIGVSTAALLFQMKERQLRLAKERELLLVKAERDDLKEEVSEVSEAKQHIEQELSRIREQLSQAAQQLAEEHQTKETLAKSVEDRQREIDRLGKDLEQIRGERTSLTEQLTQLKTQRETLVTQLAQAEQAKLQLEEKLLASAENPMVELDRVVVTGPSPGASASDGEGLQGQVVVVNREYDFIVMNMGKNQGLSIGQEFQVLRGQQVVGRVRVEKIYDELSAAAILPDSNKDAIREGDLVKAI